MKKIVCFVWIMSGCAQTVHSLFKPEELALEKQWFGIRDIFFGRIVKQDITRTLGLAAACEHKEAQWLTRVFAGKTVSTREEARDVFLALGENDARGLCFAALLDDSDDEKARFAALRRSAELGCALAQAIAKGTSEEKFRFATLAAAQRERDGFFQLGRCFNHSLGCEKNEDKARENYLIAAELGHVFAMTQVGICFDESDPRRWLWWGRAAKLGTPNWFLNYFSTPVQQFESGTGNAAVVFQIGRALNENVDVEKRTIFGKKGKFDVLIGPANSAISFYKSQLSACCRAVNAWSHVGIRWNVVKDIRVLIGKMIWETRDLALFDVREDNAVVNSQMKKC
jgi:hypothetical protein